MCLTGVRLQTGFYFVLPDRARVSCQFRINYVWDMIRSLYALLWTYFFELNVRNSFYLFWFTYEVELFHQHGRMDLITDLLWRLGTFILWTSGLILKLSHILALFGIFFVFFFLNFVYFLYVIVVTFECYQYNAVIENISLVYHTYLFYLFGCFYFGHFVDIFDIY